MSIAYALRAEYEDSYVGGVLCVGPNGESLDTKQALEEGDGVIVVADHDQFAVTALDHAPAFKRVAVPDSPPDPVDRFDTMTVPELQDVAKGEFGIEKPPRTRDELLATVRAAANPSQEG